MQHERATHTKPAMTMTAEHHTHSDFQTNGLGRYRCGTCHEVIGLECERCLGTGVEHTLHKQRSSISTDVYLKPCTQCGGWGWTFWPEPS